MKIYIEKSGNDILGDGSVSAPFASIQRALEAITCVRDSNSQQHIEVIVKEGTYTIPSQICVSEKHSNTTFRAEGKVELCGAIALENLSWQDCEHNSNIEVAKIQAGLEIDGLYANSEHQIMARYPNYCEGVVPLGGATTESDLKARAENYKTVENGFIRAIHSHGWGGNSYIITDKDKNSPLGLSLKWVGDNNRGSEYHKRMLVIENILEELDAPNEWYYNKSSGELYFYPDLGLDLNNAVIEVSVNSDILKFVNASNVVFDGFIFSKTSRTMFTVEKPNKKYVPLLRGDWAVVRAGAILIENCENVNIVNSSFKDIYGNAIFISGKNSGHKIDNNEFHNIGSSCIQVVGMDTSVYEPTFWERNEEGFEHTHTIHKTTVDMPEKTGPKTDEYPFEIDISNNHMHKMGIYEKQSCGVNVSMSRRVKIINNTIHNSARSCININDGTFGGHIIAYNDIFNSQRETTDHGPFNSWGRDRFWSVPNYNVRGLFGNAARPYALIDAIETIHINNNRFYHDGKLTFSWGIDLDDGSSNYEIYNNLCLGIGVKLREGFNRYVHNNIIINGQFQIHCTYEYANDVIKNNIVINSNPWGFSGKTSEDQKRLHDGNYNVDSNWYFSPDNAVSLPSFWSEEGYDTNCITNQNPNFKDILTNDYTVTNIDAMDKVGFFNFDMVNVGKPNCEFKSPSYIFNGSENVEHLSETEWNGAIISNISFAIMSATATNGTFGIYFKDVPENSTAYGMGFRTNQVLKEWQNKKIENVEEFLELN